MNTLFGIIENKRWYPHFVVSYYIISLVLLLLGFGLYAETGIWWWFLLSGLSISMIIADPIYQKVKK